MDYDIFQHSNQKCFYLFSCEIYPFYFKYRDCWFLYNVCGEHVSVESGEKKLKKTEPSRRDFLILTSSAIGAVGAAGFVWSLVDSMNPSADVLALSAIDVNIAPVKEGQAITVKWRGMPIFIRHRTKEEIEEANKVNLGDLRDPEADSKRAQKPEWLILVGICTHLGCVPLGQKTTDNKGEFGGWFCPCHGSEYDTSGRIRKGPAPKNLEIPPYKFVSDTVIRIGKEV